MVQRFFLGSGDIISIKICEIDPVDARLLLHGDPLKIDQSALTGESLPVIWKSGNNVYSGSTCKQREIEAVVIVIGVHTSFGKELCYIGSTNQAPSPSSARLSVTITIGSHHLSKQGAITKRMDVLCSDKIGTLTLNKFSVDRCRSPGKQ